MESGLSGFYSKFAIDDEYAIDRYIIVKGIKEDISSNLFDKKGRLFSNNSNLHKNKSWPAKSKFSIIFFIYGIVKFLQIQFTISGSF